MQILAAPLLLLPQTALATTTTPCTQDSDCENTNSLGWKYSCNTTNNSVNGTCYDAHASQINGEKCNTPMFKCVACRGERPVKKDEFGCKYQRCPTCECTEFCELTKGWEFSCDTKTSTNETFNCYDASATTLDGEVCNTPVVDCNLPKECTSDQTTTPVHICDGKTCENGCKYKGCPICPDPQSCSNDKDCAPKGWKFSCAKTSIPTLNISANTCYDAYLNSKNGSKCVTPVVSCMDPGCSRTYTPTNVDEDGCRWQGCPMCSGGNFLSGVVGLVVAVVMGGVFLF